MSTYEDHYRKYLPVYEELAMTRGGKTVWIPTDAHDGWYVTEPVDDENSEAWEKGYPNKSRPSILPDDLSADVERTAYTTITYADDESYKDSYFRETEDGYEWLNNDSDRLPDYGDMVAWALFVDIDIDKNYKTRPLPDEHKEVVNQRLNLWVKAFSNMAGSRDSVMLLDSGGGMYVFVPPTALSPISERYDKEELDLIFQEIGDRMRKVTGKLDDLICEEDDAPQELFSADKVQNVNRQFKTIGSIHKGLNAVVYPLYPDNLDITHKSVDSIDDDDVDEAIEWAEKFTSDKHTDAVESIVEYLFQGQFTKRDDMDIDYVEGTNWKDILDSWVEEKKESIQRWQINQEKRDNISEKKLKTDITQDKDIAREAIRRVNNQMLKKYIVDYLGKDLVYEKGGSEEMDFFPFWRGQSTQSGRSAFYDYYEGKARFTDKADGTSRDIVYWVALEMTYDDENYPNTHLLSHPSENLSGHEYKMAIEELRNRGEEIPILVREVDKEEDEELPDWQIKDLAKQLGIASDSDIIVDKNGDEVLKPEDWNQTLDRLSSEGIIHNRDKREPLTVEDIDPPNNETVRNEYEEIGDYLIFDDSGYYLPYFDTKEEYNEFIDSLPKYVIPFTYEGDELAGGSGEGVFAGVFIEQDNTYLLLSKLEPFPLETIDNMDSHHNLTIEFNQKIKKDEINILR